MLKQTLLVLHALLQSQLRAPDGVASAPYLSSDNVTAESRRVLQSWSMLDSVKCHARDDDWGTSVIRHLLRIGIVEPATVGTGSGAVCNVRLKPLQEAVAVAQQHWRQLGEVELPLERDREQPRQPAFISL